MEEIIKNLEVSTQLLNQFHLFTGVNKILFENDSDSLIDLCNDLIDKNKLIKIEKISSENNFYEKYYLYENANFSFVLIKWKKDSSSKIHDHPDKGCIMRILRGSLKEETYSLKLNKISEIILNKDKIGYRQGKKILHKIIALEDTISIHVYIPGYYKANIY
jgi:hypothetical protein